MSCPVGVPSFEDAAAAAAAEIGIANVIVEDLLTYHFRSSENPRKWHTVDLRNFNLSGECSCEDFQQRICKLLTNRLLRPHTPRSKCIHIERAERILNFIIKKGITALNRTRKIE